MDVKIGIQNYTCPLCGAQLIHSNTFMNSEMRGIDIPESDDTFVYILTCPKCGADIEVWERNDYED